MALLWPVALLNYLDRQVLSTLQPAIGMDISAVLDSQNFGRLMGIFLWIYGLMSPISGLVADRFSRKRLLLTMFGLFAVATLACGLAPGYWTLLAARGTRFVVEVK